MHTALRELKAFVEGDDADAGSCSSPARAGSARRRPRRRPRSPCADRGARTLVLSTDPAHSLADAFDVDLGDQPGPIAPGLWGQQLDATERMEESWGDIQAWLQEVFAWAGLDAVEAEELAVLPGLDEVFALADIKTHADVGRLGRHRRRLRADRRDDPAPARLPDVLTWYMERLFPIGRRVNKVVSPVLGRLTTLPGRRRRGVRRRPPLLRPARRREGAAHRPGRSTSVRLVVNPERMVIAEARRTYTYLSLFGYRVDCVIANRLLPDEVTDPWFDRWRELHAEHLAAIEEGFAPLPVLRADLAGDELVGLDRAARLRRRPLRRGRPRRRPPRRRAAARSPSGGAGTCSSSSCRSPTATTSTSAGAATSCSSASARTAGRSCCPTRSAAGRSRGRRCSGGQPAVTFGARRS